ncbi:uncharacterized protein LOC143282379 [Babylonia areolata]|uniref:uncharacterized protein LOC143282379 n=1 Tax=Babylonia areolata TaxID=304850 RepID=UPI003FD04F29
MCGTASWWAKLALVCMFLAVLLQIGGVASANWMIYKSAEAGIELDVGLWRQKNCTSGTCQSSSVNDAYETEEFNAVRGLETVVLCLTIILSVLLIIYLCAEGARVLNFVVFLIVVCFITGLASLVGTFLWVTTVPSPFVASYSMGLTVLACLLILLAGTLLIPDALNAEDAYPSSRSVSPTGPSYPDRRTVITPISHRHGGYYRDSGFRF